MELKNKIKRNVYTRIYKYLNHRNMLLGSVLVSLKRKRIINFDYEGWIDTIRVQQLELVAYEILEKDLSGSVAELGVYKGGFAKRINEVFPKKKLYLFDTFEGFDPVDIQIDKDSGYQRLPDWKLDIRFKDTSEGVVLSNMPHPEMCEIKKGYFPDTAMGMEDESYCFVSIDTDLYKPIYEGLCYFYPRLVRGGYIFVHDYNEDGYPGAKDAILKYCSENGIPYVPIPDASGSVIIAK